MPKASRGHSLSDLLASAGRPRVGPRRGTKITEDDPRWDARKMGNKTGMYRGRWYVKGKKVPFDKRGQ